ncbi:hypothetical protein [Cohnella sp. AR92]|uniref:hypothetical protein n=1 Tax=Cohnella sp. AR92 TaxID=648716 RepID=UPI000F8F056F|nr:hypothetical protein [Cohnella sp. AR92]RUS48382.1 hypothetical protein ELR57_02885 [Cohnella sp. AR92]
MKDICETQYGEVIVVTTQKPNYTWEVTVSSNEIIYSRFFFDQHSANLVHKKVKEELGRNKTVAVEEELREIMKRSIGINY